jgi:prepilin-type N-terminal cleavage/methylation domain-containing protein
MVVYTMLNNENTGFTLIELSIVLVIIGLLTGGVLVGQDMIYASRIRSQVTQMEKFKAAAITFAVKYNVLPGDMNPGDAAKFGMIARTGNPGDGDANGVIEGCTPGSSYLGCETVFFWSDLSYAGLIEGRYSDQTDTYIRALGPHPKTSPYLPPAKLGRGISVVVFPLYNVNYFAIVNIGSVIFGYMSLDTNHSVTTGEAFNIDTKLDDGKLTTGNIQAVGGVSGPLGTPGNISSPANHYGCYLNDPGNPYNLANPNLPACAIWIKAGF